MKRMPRKKHVAIPSHLPLVPKVDFLFFFCRFEWGNQRQGALTADYKECSEGIGFCWHYETSPAKQRGAGRPSGVGGFASASYDGLSARGAGWELFTQKVPGGGEDNDDGWYPCVPKA